MIRRLRVVWRRARRTGRDLDAAAYAAFVAGGVLFLVAFTGALGPSLDAHAAPHSARSASADRATF
ncbi:hypothetical protein LMG26696_03325 [Achromobacter pulmonis]|uniref:hypothetical protein n=1 Tax=Achromobacter pulmonis TaxID=1389932 RepID=UPI001465B2D4|nr:hypothetical protein [Achromobacter pulmonis]CAB3660099.1 hypothetical protein LMG26696_03325 [Achromobacter pulmonis]